MAGRIRPLGLELKPKVRLIFAVAVVEVREVKRE
jgi:hypothetical protein